MISYPHLTTHSRKKKSHKHCKVAAFGDEVAGGWRAEGWEDGVAIRGQERGQLDGS